MKLIIDRAALNAALKRCASAVPNQTPIPVLKHVMLEAARGKLRLTATDIEVRIRIVVPCETEETGACTIPHAPLAQFIAALPDGSQCSLDATKDRVIIKAGRSRVTLPVLQADTFPALDLVKPIDPMPFDAAILSEVLRRTQATILNNNLAGYEGLTCLLLALGGPKPRAVSCNRYGAAVVHFPQPELIGDERIVLLPFMQVRAIREFIPAEGEIAVTIAENGVDFADGSASIFARISGGKYPGVEQLVSKTDADSKSRAQFSVTDLKAALARVVAADQGKDRAACLEFSGSTLKISASGEAGFEGADEIDITYDGEPFIAHYRLTLLRPMLDAIPAEKATARLGAPQDGLIIETGGEDRWLVMPFKA